MAHTCCCFLRTEAGSAPGGPPLDPASVSAAMSYCSSPAGGPVSADPLRWSRLARRARCGLRSPENAATQRMPAAAEKLKVACGGHNLCTDRSVAAYAVSQEESCCVQPNSLIFRQIIA